ncbi:cytochrome c biogenesis protein CcdA [Entomobacter blattae]|uniref:Thiol:disulfide interchange protein DsbD n=1 Tax=Entomobacter blattae TaxID=2762277 RepID=A0A7H1NUS0_9PROT|nr:thioredoxin family protein [Entomobacter blattae]QNT79530.1 Thiol:disulfide interchange protein DsbD [Entomobacter blattae]
MKKNYSIFLLVIGLIASTFFSFVVAEAAPQSSFLSSLEEKGHKEEKGDNIPQQGQTNWVVNRHSRAAIMVDTYPIQLGKPFTLGLQLELAKGWHTYWLNPGDAGSAADITLPSEVGGMALRAGSLQWPVPQRIPEGPLTSFAYQGQVMLMQPLTLLAGPQNGPSLSVGQRDVVIPIKAQWLVCEKICVPEEASFTLKLPVASHAQASAQAPLFATARQALPQPSPFEAFLDENKNLVLKGHGLSRETVHSAQFFPARQGAIDLSFSSSPVVGDSRIVFPLKWLVDPEAVTKGVVVLKDNKENSSALWIETKVGRLTASTVANTARGGERLAVGKIVNSLVFAVLGGLLLNVMPCVFPVLAVKTLSVLEVGHSGLAKARRKALVYVCGVVVTFTMLGLLMMGGRAIGLGNGWGTQFQSPLFVIGMVWFLLLLALNLLGLFEIGAGMTALGQKYIPAHGYWHDFATGVLVVVLSTPCTAPFMGVAVAAAFVLPAWLGGIVFLFLGLGLALPYWVMMWVPALARIMPKPGKWMVYIRQGLAFPLLFTCVWLVWVVSLQGGSPAVALTLTGGVIWAFLAWLWGMLQFKESLKAKVGRFVILMLGGGLCLAVGSGYYWGLWKFQPPYSLVGLSSAQGMPTEAEKPLQKEAKRGQDSGLVHEVYTPQLLERLTQAHQPVFVDVTAAWCITCIVNEKVALESASVKRVFQDNHIHYLVADWTHQNPAISAFLKHHHRDGVPLYVFYPSRGNPQILPQLLTPSLVASILQKP